jgi:ABC-type amino acid transport substrate-binding protein
LKCLLIAGLVAGSFFPADADDLVPTGTLRATFIASNPVQAVTDAKTGAVSGPAADIGRELARRLNVPFTIKGVPGVQPVIDSVKNREADIGFVAFDPVRAAQVDFSPPYSLAQNTYLVREGSPIRSAGDVDRPGVRIVPDNFCGVEQAIVVAKGKAALLAKLDQLIDETRAAGFIAAAIARAGLVGVDVAPPRQR